MAEIITQREYKALLPLEDISEQSFRQYMNHQAERKELTSLVVSPFTKSIYDQIPYSDDNRPEDEVVKTIDISDKISFDVTVKPTFKRPAYARIIEDVENYLEQRELDYKQGKKVQGILTINDEPFILAEDVITKVVNLMSEYREGKEGVSRTIAVRAPDDLINNVPDSLVVVFGQDYGKLTQQNAQAYLKAKSLIKESDANAREYKALMLEESLKQIGTDSVSSVSSILYAYGDVAFEHQLEPRATPRHKDVVEALIKAVPEKITKRSRAGDLAVAVQLTDQDKIDFYRTKGLISNAWMDHYAPRIRDGKAFISLRALRTSIQRYREEFVTEGVEQNLRVVLR